MTGSGNYPAISYTCPNCGTQFVTMDVYAVHQDIQDNFVFNAYCVCRRCSKPCLAELRSRYTNSYPLTPENAGNMLNGLYHISIAQPIIPAADNAPEFVPSDIGAIFLEATRCEAISCFDAAGAMFRKVLDAATRQLIDVEPQSVDKSHPDYISYKQAKDLRLRLDWLFERNKLPQSLADLVSCVHQDGNDAAHSLDSIGADAAADLHDFTASILESLYTIPGRIERNIARREARRASAS